MAITLDGTTGITTPGLTNTGTETIVNLTTTGNTTLGDATTDTLTVGVTGIVKDASGNVGIGTASPSYRLSAQTALTGTTAGSNTVGSFYSNGNGYDSNIRFGDNTNSATVLGYLSGNMYMFTGGAERMRIDSSGNVGIGTSSPGYALQVGINSTSVAIGGSATSNGTARLKFLSSNTVKNWQISTNDAIAGSLEFTPSTVAGGSTFTTPAMLLDTNGNLLVGQSAVNFAALGASISTNDGANQWRLNISNSSSTNTGYGLSVYSTGAAAYRFYLAMNGQIYATSTSITGISDQRLKENIRDLDDGLEKLMALKPRKFDWKEGKGGGIKNARGFIAQEFETIFPDLIEEWLDPAPEGEEPYKAVNANLIPTLVKAIQEQQALIQSLTTRITALEIK